MSKPVVKAEEESLKQHGPPDIIELKNVYFEQDERLLKRRESVYTPVESERELTRRIRAKEDLAKPWYFTHI